MHNRQPQYFLIPLFLISILHLTKNLLAFKPENKNQNRLNEYQKSNEAIKTSAFPTLPHDCMVWLKVKYINAIGFARLRGAGLVALIQYSKSV